MADPTRRASKRHPTRRTVDSLLVEEAIATWIPPTLGIALLAAGALLNALGMIAEPLAGMLAVGGLLLLGVFAVVAPLARDAHPRLRPLALGGLALVWIGIFAVPFAARLFPGAPVATTPLDPQHAAATLAVGAGNFDLVLDAHLPAAAEHQSRQLHYALTITDGAGQGHRYDGELGDQWQMRRLGRRGSAPVHLEHLSTTHAIDNSRGGELRLNEVTLSGVPGATLVASIYRRRVPAAAWLVALGVVLVAAALAFDFWWDARRTPTAALLTATATGAALVFCSSAAGHPGLRQVFGSTIVGGMTGLPAAGIAAWVARRIPWTRKTTSQRAT